MTNTKPRYLGRGTSNAPKVKQWASIGFDFDGDACIYIQIKAGTRRRFAHETELAVIVDSLNDQFEREVSK